MNRLTIFAGHYGSGKTNIAVNYALAQRAAGQQVQLCDLDIVNPYFRTADAAPLLQQQGIKLIASPYANTNLESPALPGDVRAAFDNAQAHTILDVGGDDRGMTALGRYADDIAGLPHELLLVCNAYRPLAATPRDALALMREMEQAAHLAFTALVNNANLGAATTLAEVEASLPYMAELAQLTGLPVVLTCLREPLATQWQHGEVLALTLIDNRFGL